ncbi:hypothetical protein PHYBLDRAFT_169411 [Phycomyces blakesleeanus NRRL 1555(-)]|uniref:Uncharacterized protein n=1 Tax=Phycomyces blakesleeanus (strain ATCC 8743b / DSM 1359 / FGSC 10004 / NBRC 33097 / NRRL 1555) TaxID=763407 RepID=A0A163AB25_PHYB8|nr:hypothetical protein PHYBLDRAFT_169411 [Phycomyces blakesleeanus NRRL 1555(-)]OAD72271.1 hypothetical protein PHYBLDRAFT_169411 [Phycomyces blakesleeanus NRRL 1555(-)]|eukprot:XP_018290311.1 hypothetical protein PHYBLDRAFT_169411 [Phycomyces blakesleeanus NRRL 1555(-)]
MFTASIMRLRKHILKIRHKHSLTHEFTLLIIVSQSFRTDTLDKQLCRGPVHVSQGPPSIFYAMEFEKHEVNMSSRIQRIRFSFKGLDSRIMTLSKFQTTMINERKLLGIARAFHSIIADISIT